MFCQQEIEEELELYYQAKPRPERESRRPPQSYSSRFDKRRSPAGARNGIQRRGTRTKFAAA